MNTSINPLEVLPMDIFSLISPQESDSMSPGIFDTLKQALTQRLATFDNVVYPPDGIKEAKRDKAELKS